jgi:hypothetical protein
MKIIQTKYNGYYFRSRTEARWAVFFDTVGFKYEYEPEGFVINIENKEMPYLPDFYLDEFNLYLEIKNENFEKNKEFNEYMWKVLHFENQIALLLGPPKPGMKMKMPSWIYNYETNEKTNEWEIIESFISNSGEWFLNWGNDDCLYEDLYKEALNASRSARFEHGEKPEILR